MIIKNIDNGLKTFGKGAPIHQVSEILVWQNSFYFFRFTFEVIRRANIVALVLKY